uniref:Galactosylgalactosylxylosylprotein 3-beta-glucuronosyltransferase n=1 Tax=Cyprinus carpio TaxID=7962 RepID=A0A8C1J2G6_CYPCA
TQKMKIIKAHQRDFRLHESCVTMDKCITKATQIKYVYQRPPPWSDTLTTLHVITVDPSRSTRRLRISRNKRCPEMHVSHAAPCRGTWLSAGSGNTSIQTPVIKESCILQMMTILTAWRCLTRYGPFSPPFIVSLSLTDSIFLILQMRWTRKVSVWPVAFVGGLRYESPKINSQGKVFSWKTVFDPQRPFGIDMAGFAVNLQLILGKPQACFKLKGVKGGYQESSLLQDLVTLSDLEPKAANCTKILVWHTRTERPLLTNEGKKRFMSGSMEV